MYNIGYETTQTLLHNLPTSRHCLSCSWYRHRSNDILVDLSCIHSAFADYGWKVVEEKVTKQITDMESPSTMIILTPVYNDWHSFMQLTQDVDECAVHLNNVSIRIIAVDDGSTYPLATMQRKVDQYKYIRDISILHLARNLGHQKAIALGIAYINANLSSDVVIVMDADGEDQAQDIRKLLRESENFPEHIIFARRTRRSENWIFRLFYILYKVLFKLLTGKQITFGNFSLIPTSQLNRVAHLPEIWNHFAAGIMRANIPWSSIATQRGNRYSGRSSMNFVALVIHGLSAISVYSEILSVRLILFAIIIILIGITGFLVLLYVKYLTPLAIPGWATNVAIGIVVITFQAILLLVMLTFVSLNYRISQMFIPAKNYQDYLLNLEQIHAN
jgi:polyisoprenyl-phosphate glycosyltransferase